MLHERDPCCFYGLGRHERIKAFFAKRKAKKAGKKSQGKKSIGSKPPATPEGGKRTGGSTGNMTVNQYRAFLQQVKKNKKK